MKSVLTFVRKIPLVGWLAVALVAVALLYFRASRRSALSAAKTAAARRALEARRELETARRADEAVRDKAIKAADDELTAKMEALAVVEDRIEHASGQKLSDEINAFFNKGKP